MQVENANDRFQRLGNEVFLFSKDKAFHLSPQKAKNQINLGLTFDEEHTFQVNGSNGIRYLML